MLDEPCGRVSVSKCSGPGVPTPSVRFVVSGLRAEVAMTTADDQRALVEQQIAECWQCIADAECERDADHARRAWAQLQELVPRQREARE